jgi:HSP20 family protein
VRKEDIDIRIDGNQVTISAEVKTEKEDGRERQQGYASPSFTLACPVDETKSDAKYKDGVLELKLPKKATTSSKRLAIE